jgi:hypothetical protein
VKPVLIRQHEEVTPPGLLVDWLRERGIPFEVHPSWLGVAAPDLTNYSFVASLVGGRVERAPVPELGWREIETDDPAAVPAGPWLEWHYERFTTPPSAIEVARTADAVQAFRFGPHLGVQFHPESTVEIISHWASMDAKRLAEIGIEDGAALLAASPERKAAAKSAGFRLFDAFLDAAMQYIVGESGGDAGGKE